MESSSREQVTNDSDVVHELVGKHLTKSSGMNDNTKKGKLGFRVDGG